MSDPLKVCKMLQIHGSRWEVLDTQGVLALEPSLSRAAENISGGIYYPDEASGDARSFTLCLADRARSLGAEIRTGARVSRIVVEQGCTTGVIVNGENLDGEVVLAAGIDSPQLSRRLGLRLAIKPAKGYSLTMDISGAGEGPKIPIMDHHGHVGIVPLGQRLRLVGTAEFAGRDLSIPQARIDKLFSVFQRLFPHMADRVDRSAALAWAGLRPISPDGMPYIGATATPGLWVNSGHGSMGWSMAPGSARLLVDLMQGHDPDIDPSPFSVTR
jgi:D-amino-acid dehydrogenase